MSLSGFLKITHLGMAAILGEGGCNEKPSPPGVSDSEIGKPYPQTKEDRKQQRSSCSFTDLRRDYRA